MSIKAVCRQGGPEALSAVGGREVPGRSVVVAACVSALSAVLLACGCSGSRSSEAPSADAAAGDSAGQPGGVRPMPAALSALEPLGAHAFQTSRGICVYLHDPACGDERVEELVGILESIDEVNALRLSRTSLGDAAAVQLARLTGLEELALAATPLGDAGLRSLGELPRLRQLDLEATRISDASLAHLAGLGALEVLSLAKTSISDDGLPHLAGLARLKSLDLSETKVTNQGLAALAGLENLERLRVFGTEVDESGVEALKASLPATLVVR